MLFKDTKNSCKLFQQNDLYRYMPLSSENRNRDNSQPLNGLNSGMDGLTPTLE